jgi:hypothetical protein
MEKTATNFPLPLGTLIEAKFAYPLVRNEIVFPEQFLMVKFKACLFKASA